MMPRTLALLLFCLLSAACPSKAPPEPSLGALREVQLPNGWQLRAEVMVRPQDMARGMMFRDSLPLDRGMLFVHTKPGRYPYWMHQVKISLDIIWLDASKTIVEISENTPPCASGPEACPNYGGNQDALFILELAGGSVSRHNLKVGDRIQF